jgi:hypothetical protein
MNSSDVDVELPRQHGAPVAQLRRSAKGLVPWWTVYKQPNAMLAGNTTATILECFSTRNLPTLIALHASHSLRRSSKFTQRPCKVSRAASKTQLTHSRCLRKDRRWPQAGTAKRRSSTAHLCRARAWVAMADRGAARR